MKERRAAGATHSFRLTQKAALIVDGIVYPRRHGGKSRRVSQAIEWFWSSPTIGPKDGTKFVSFPTAYRLVEENEELKANIAALQEIITDLGSKNYDYEAPSRGGRLTLWLKKLGIL